MHTGWLTTSIAGLAFTAAALGAAPDAAAQTVGKLTAEKATVSRAGTRLRAGNPVSLGDRLASSASGSGMIVFDDQSSARMGPNAVLTIDEFVYNPSRRSGAIRLRQTNGAARIYGGQISKRGKSEVRTPHIVLAVRGGIVDTNVSGGQTIATLRGGLMVCRVGNRKKTVTNPGVSCISDGSTLLVQRITGGGRRLVTPSNPGQGSASTGRYDSAQCGSVAGLFKKACRSRDGRLPRPEVEIDDRTLSGGPAGTTNCANPQNFGVCY